MISGAMAVAAAGPVRSERALYAREARLARVQAMVADIVIVGAITFVVNGVFGVEQVTSGTPIQNAAGFSQFTTSTTVPWPWLTLLGILYFTATEAMFGGSPGKLWARLRVVRADRLPLNLSAVLIRNLLKPIDWLPVFYLLGGTSVLVTAHSQRLGDLAAGTTVVYRHRALEPGATLSSSPHARRVGGIILSGAMLFVAAFNYFGRPPLVMEGLFNTQRLGAEPAASYVLGSAQWGFGTVTYPVETRSLGTNALCSGTITLNWFVLGWVDRTSTLNCATG
jgi:uncharacterized RDD family membrane protein YckC